LQIKLGLIKKLSRLWIQRVLLFSTLDKCFQNCQNAKLKEGIFVGPQIRKIVKDPQFEEKLNHIELSASHDFLGNKKAENYEETIKESIRRDVVKRRFQIKRVS
jgi:hypothetical protein